jgi:alkylation response protein AidB-like acyl-CoA dehydrogenase
MASPASLIKPIIPVLREHAATHDESATFPVEAMAALREHRLLGLLVPTEYGGLGADLTTFVEVASGLSAHCLSTGQIWAMHCFQVDAIVRYGSPQLRANLLPRVAAGDVYIASVTSERGRKADLLSAATPLDTDGDRVVIERSAPVVTGGEHADGYLITMRRSPTAAESEVSLVYADRGDLQVETVGRWDSLGVRATESIGMVLKGAVPAYHVVGEPGGFAEIARESMVPISHLGWSACWLGTAKGAFTDVVRWSAKSASADRRHGAAGQSDLLYERLGQVRVALELVSSYLTRVRQEIDQARAAKASLCSPRHRLQLNTLKIAASDLTFRAVNDMLQIVGLRSGYLKDSEIPMERHFRDLRSASLNHANDRLLVGVGALSMLDRNVTLI